MLGPSQPPPAPFGRLDAVILMVGSRNRHPIPQGLAGDRRTVDRSGAADIRPRGSGERPSHGRLVRRSHHPAAYYRRATVARSVGAAQPPPGPVVPAGGRPRFSRYGAAATRLRRAGGSPSHGRAGAAATRTSRVAGSRSVRHSRHLAPSPGGRPSHGLHRPGAATFDRRRPGFPSHGRSVRRSRHPAPQDRLEAWHGCSVRRSRPQPRSAGWMPSF